MANPFLEESGITHPNLGGAQVMDAGWEVFNPGYWWQKGSDWEHGTDHANEYEIPWKFWEQDREPLGGLAGLGAMGQTQMSPPWRSAEGYGPLENTEKEWNKAQIRMNEPSARAAEDQLFQGLTEQGLYPWNFRTRPMTTEGNLLYNDVGNQLWDLTAYDVEQMEPQMEAQSQWKRPENMEKTIQALKLRPEFEGWTDEAIKTWIYNTARANRGGIIGLL